jgi:hypothetical protein
MVLCRGTGALSLSANSADRAWPEGKARGNPCRRQHKNGLFHGVHDITVEGVEGTC